MASDGQEPVDRWMLCPECTPLGIPLCSECTQIDNSTSNTSVATASSQQPNSAPNPPSAQRRGSILKTMTSDANAGRRRVSWAPDVKPDKPPKKYDEKYKATKDNVWAPGKCSPPQLARPRWHCAAAGRCCCLPHARV